MISREYKMVCPLWMYEDNSLHFYMYLDLLCSVKKTSTHLSFLLITDSVQGCRVIKTIPACIGWEALQRGCQSIKGLHLKTLHSRNKGCDLIFFLNGECNSTHKKVCASRESWGRLLKSDKLPRVMSLESGWLRVEAKNLCGCRVREMWAYQTSVACSSSLLDAWGHNSCYKYTHPAARCWWSSCIVGKIASLLIWTV